VFSNPEYISKETVRKTFSFVPRIFSQKCRDRFWCACQAADCKTILVVNCNIMPFLL
jgi:hypothetical protein